MINRFNKNPYVKGISQAAALLGAGRALYRGARGAYKYTKKTRKSNYVRVPKRARTLRPKKNLRALAKDVNNLRKKVNVNNTLFTKKYRVFNNLTVATNQTGYVAQTLNSASVIEGVIDGVKYFNPAAPGTLVTVDLSAPTYQQRVRITKSYLSALIRNNYSVPCAVDVYFLKCKKDTSIAPQTAITNSIADMTNGALTTSQIYPTDCHDFNDLWKIAKHTRKIMQAGSQFEFTGSCPAFDYDVSLTDSETESYMRYSHGSIIMIRVEGILGHGATSGVGCMAAGVDVEYRRNHTVEYSGGVNTQYIEIDENTQTISGTHQCSQLNNEQASYAL